MDILRSARELTYVGFDTDKYIYDLESSVCMIYRDGLYYQFAHRSFQEYFSAVFLKELPDEKMKQLSKEVVHKDISRAINDSVFGMLYDMTPQRFENNILLPLIEEIEKSVDNELYDHYLRKIVSSIGFSFFSAKETLELGVVTVRDSLESFLFHFSFYYRDRSDIAEQRKAQIEQQLMEYLQDSDTTELRDADIKEILSSPQLYQLVKDSWIGERLKTLCSLRKDILQRQESTDEYLTRLMRK